MAELMSRRQNDTVSHVYTTDGRTVVAVLAGGVGGFLFMVLVTSLIIWIFRRRLRKSPIRPHSGKCEPRSIKSETSVPDYRDETMLPIRNHRRANLPIGDYVSKPTVVNRHVKENNGIKQEQRNVLSRALVMSENGRTNRNLMRDEVDSRARNEANDRNNRRKNSDVEIPQKSGLKRGCVFNLFEIQPDEYKSPTSTKIHGKQLEYNASSDYDTLHSETPSIRYQGMKNASDANFMLQHQKPNPVMRRSASHGNMEGKILDVRNLPQMNPIENVFRYLYNNGSQKNRGRSQENVNNSNGNSTQIMPPDLYFRRSVSDHVNRWEYRPMRDTKLMIESTSYVNMQNPIYETEGSTSSDGSVTTRLRRHKKVRGDSVLKKNRGNAIHRGSTSDVCQQLCLDNSGYQGKNVVRRLPSQGYGSGEVTPEQTLHIDQQSVGDEVFYDNTGLNYKNLREATHIMLENVETEKKLSDLMKSPADHENSEKSRMLESGDHRQNMTENIRDNKKWFSSDIGEKFNENDGNSDVVYLNYRNALANNNKNNMEMCIKKGMEQQAFKENLARRNQPIRYHSRQDLAKEIPSLTTYKSFLQEISQDLQQDDGNVPYYYEKVNGKKPVYIPKTSTIYNKTRTSGDRKSLPHNDSDNTKQDKNSNSSPVKYEELSKLKQRGELNAAAKQKKAEKRESRDDRPNWKDSGSSGLEFIEDRSRVLMPGRAINKALYRHHILPLHRIESMQEYQHFNISYV